MRFLHTGDLHLDGAFSDASPKEAEALRDQGRRLLQRIFEVAAAEKCQMILFAGDVFDSRFVSNATGELFVSLVESCNIPVVVSPGNHDFYTDNSFWAKAWKRLGDKLTLFTSNELQVFDFDELGVSVFGYAFTSINLSESPLSACGVPEENGYMRILCAHADLSSPISRKAPLTLPEIAKLDFAYAALGHIHRPADCEDEDGRVRYCGFAEGRGFDECGEGGVLLVDADAESCEVRRLALSSRQYQILTLHTFADSEDELYCELCEAIRSNRYSGEVRLRIVLEGNTDGGVSLTDELCGRIRNECGLSALELQDNRLPVPDGAALERDITLKGQLYRVLKPMLVSDDAHERRKALRALKIGLAAIDSKPFFDM